MWVAGSKANDGIVRAVFYQWRVRGMSSQSSTYDPQEIHSILLANGMDWISQPEFFESIGSTNDYLLNGADSVHGRVCITDYQTQGKGRMGKKWHSTQGGNLMFSLGWRPAGPLHSEISLLAGVALADALSKAGVRLLGLKWPNDLLQGERKLAGILVESRVCGSQIEVVVGVGLNIEHQASDLKAVDRPWTDLAQLGMKNVDRQQILLAVLTELGIRLHQLEVQGFEPIRRDWLKYHVYQDTLMSFQHQGRTRTGRVLGLDESGALLFRVGEQIIAVNSGEVSCLRGAS